MAELVAIEAATFRFSELEMETLMAEIHRDLADLRYLDLALAHIAEIESWHEWGPVRNLTAFEAIVDVSLGRKYPFVRRVMWLEYSNWAFWNSRERLEQDLKDLEEDANPWAQGEVAAANRQLAQLKHPVGAQAFEDLDREPATTANQLRTEIDENFGRTRHLGSWRGRAADNFETEFYRPFAEVRENQIALTESIRAALQCSQVTAHIGHYSLMNVLTAVSSALDEQLRLRSESGGAGDQVSTRETFAVLAASTAVMAAMTVQVAPLAGALALVSASAELASVILPDTERGVTTRISIEGASAETLSTALYDQLVQIGNYLDVQYDELLERLTEVDGDVRDFLSSRNPKLFPKRPHVADGDVNPDDFHHESADR